MLILQRNARRISAMVAAFAAAFATLATVSPSPAQAHSESSAIYYGCGSGYFVVSDGRRDITYPNGNLIGKVVLTYNSSNGKNCVVTYKPTGTSLHGIRTEMLAAIKLFGQPAWHSAVCDCYHWESVTVYARNTCVIYEGYIRDPEGDTHVASRHQWGNCG